MKAVYEFKHAVKVAGQFFARGIREVSEEVEKHADFAFFKKAGYIAAPGKGAVEKKLEDLKELPPPKSAQAAQSAQAAKAVQAQADAEPEASDAEAPKKSGKKGK